jgi:hypothetical protein
MPEGKVSILIRVSVSNRGFDLDNSAKPIIDNLQVKYDWNDNQAYFIGLKKEIVKKGAECIDLDIRGQDGIL